MNVATQADMIAAAAPRIEEAVVVIPQENGTLNLRGPELRRNALSRWIAWMLRLPSRVEVALDDIGSFVIRHCDGRSMEELSDLVATTYQLTHREAQAAVTVFVKSLLQRRLLTLDGLHGSPA